jgi:hypothetical protein
METPEKTTTQVVREGLEKACREFSERISTLGFTHHISIKVSVPNGA